MIAPYTANWSAEEGPGPAGGHHIEVTGEVETRESNLLPKLRSHAPQGVNPRVLLLDLTIEPEGGLGGPVVLLHKAEYRQASSGRAYDEVAVLFEGEVIARIAVGHPKPVAKPATKPVTKPATKPAAKPAKQKPRRNAARKPARKSAKQKAAKKKTAKKANTTKKKKAAGRKKKR
jgi:hypothetical protein